jgi:hypothetical protein
MSNADLPIAVDHGVPGPATYEMQKLPWADLAPPREIDGQMLYDSFFIPGKSTKQMGSAVSLASKKNGGAKFVTRTVKEARNGPVVQGVRVLANSVSVQNRPNIVQTASKIVPR